MKKIFSLAMFVAAFLGAQAQNIQFHYDLGHSFSDELSHRPSATTTVELFHADRWGNNFLFVDIDYFHDGVAGAYWEVSRELNVSTDHRWATHVEYDGGLASSQLNDFSTRFQHCVLMGPAWNWASSDFSRTFSLQALYKYYFKGQNPWNRPFSSFQSTAVWSLELYSGWVSFSGYIDCWYDHSVKGNWVTMSEPQLWLNINKFRGMADVNLSIGTEVELSNNFVFNRSGRNDSFYAIPTLAVKWRFSY